MPNAMAIAEFFRCASSDKTVRSPLALIGPLLFFTHSPAGSGSLICLMALRFIYRCTTTIACSERANPCQVRRHTTASYLFAPQFAAIEDPRLRPRPRAGTPPSQVGCHACQPPGSIDSPPVAANLF